MAGWIVDGDPGMDLAPFDVRRFGRVAPEALYARATAAYAGYYAISAGS
ncbi:hypothetical protein ACIBHX_38575 [Nonomuraea sp. NPDC050536]